MTRVWKIAPGKRAKYWPECSERGCTAINWLNTTDLHAMSKDQIFQALKKANEGGTGSANSLYQFVNGIQKSDVVVANRGLREVAGIGVVTSDYLRPDDPRNPFRDDEFNRQTRLVDWVINTPIDLEKDVFAINTVTPLSPEQCEQIRQAYLTTYPELQEKLDQLLGVGEQIDRETKRKEENADMRTLLEQLGQIFLYGPPGTGKTREAKRLALSLLLSEQSGDSKSTDEEIEKHLQTYRNDGLFDLVVFHPAYEYEQFVGGIEPTVGQDEDRISFKARAGVFTRLCRNAETHKKPVVLVIDEINRGHLPKLLGELVYALEYRDHKVTLPFSCDGRTDLIVPKNLYIIGTMNSADQSIGHIDVAIRRRFGLYPLEAKPDVVRNVWSVAGNEDYGRQLAELMTRLNNKLAIGCQQGASPEQQVGHSYFLPMHSSSGDTAIEQVRMKWKYQVQPLLREYAQLLNLDADSLKEYFRPLDTCLGQS